MAPPALASLEEWRPLPPPFHDAYECSSTGLIRTRLRRHPLPRGGYGLVKPKLLKFAIGGRAENYLRAMIRIPGERRHAYVHSIICTVFHGPRPSADHFACHKDDIGTNNHKDNLRWGTRVDNEADRRTNSGRTAEADDDTYPPPF